MATFPRYAIYYASAPGSDLDRFGAQLLGYDAFSGEDLPFPDGILPVSAGLARPDAGSAQIRFSCHAEGAAVAGARQDRGRAAGRLRIVRRRVPNNSGHPAGRQFDQRLYRGGARANASAELERLAADCVSATSIRFRAPLTAEDRARRNPAQLTPRQREYLDRWGYPYVMEEFRFHMTLTGRLGAERREPVLTMLRNRFSALGLNTLSIDRIALFRQDNADCRIPHRQSLEAARR